MPASVRRSMSACRFSRVGGDAQTKAMKTAAGALRLTWRSTARWRSSQFSSDLDEVTKKQLQYGQGLMRLLRQPRIIRCSSMSRLSC